MSEHKASIEWKRGAAGFTYETYSRDHTLGFEGSVTVAASAAPEFLGTVGRVDPEQAFVASLASCHMLSFLAIAARKRFVVDSYADDAVGFMEKNEDGKLAITRVVLRPRIRFSGDELPIREQIEKMHHMAHDHCFLANSVRTDIRIESA